MSNEANVVTRPNMQKALDALNEYSRDRKSGRERKDVDRLLDTLLKNLTDDTSEEELRQKLSIIENVTFKGVKETPTIGDKLRSLDHMTLEDYGSKADVAVEQQTKFRAPIFSYGLFWEGKIINLEQALLMAYQALFKEYDVRFRPIREFRYTKKQIQHSQALTEFSQMRSDKSNSAVDDFKRNVTVEGKSFSDQSKEAIIEVIQEFSGDVKKAQFILDHGGQHMNQGAMFEFLNTMVSEEKERFASSFLQGSYDWNKDTSGRLFCDVSLQWTTVQNPHKPGPEGLGIYVLNAKTNLLRAVSEEELKQIQRKEISVPPLAEIQTRIGLEDKGGEIFPIVVEYKCTVLAKDIFHIEEKEPLMIMKPIY